MRLNGHVEPDATLPGISDEQKWQMWLNIKGFFDTLAGWAKREVDAAENIAALRHYDGAQ